ncbi:ABC transporter substrate-binding protein [Streptomyces sp. NPDC004787]|uniref:ABC transporter substrate-binding protein n=1 Tax=Streptomyces sp. NPDC004787 TaxID=3154291 RepID=UPI0033B647DF
MKAHNKWLTAPLAAGLAATLLSGCGTEQGGGAGDAGATVRVGMSDEIVATDPAAGYDPGSWVLFNNVFQSLLAFPKGGSEPEPDAADECAFSGGSKVYTCTLREGLKFSNGNPLTSEDVKFSFERALKIADPNGPAPLLSSIASIETPDEKTVVFRLKVADATFPSKIASGAGSIVDHRSYPADALRTDGKAVGSGPYKLDSFSETEAVFSANGGYRGNAKRKNGGVTLKLYRGDREALAKALAGGEVDVAYRGLSADDIASLENAQGDTKGIQVVQGSSAEVQHLVFNVKDPVVGKLGVRKAIAHLVDREALVQNVYKSTATPLYSIVPAGIAGHATSFFDTYGAPDKAKAEQALRKDGITGKVKLTLWSTPSRFGPSTDQMMEAIAGQLNASGLFDAKVQSVADYEQYEKDVDAGKYGVYVRGWVPDYPDADNFTSPFFGDDNVLGNRYKNALITGELLPAVAASPDRSATGSTYTKVQDLVADELPLLPLWQGKQYAVAREDVTGLEWTLDASTVFRFWEIKKG